MKKNRKLYWTPEHVQWVRDFKNTDDKEVQNSLFEKLVPALRKIINQSHYRITGNSNPSQDTTQNAMINIYNVLSTKDFLPEVAHKFFLTTARYTILNELTAKKRNRIIYVEESEGDVDTPPRYYFKDYTPVTANIEKQEIIDAIELRFVQLKDKNTKWDGLYQFLERIHEYLKENNYDPHGMKEEILKKYGYHSYSYQSYCERAGMLNLNFRDKKPIKKIF